MPDYCNVCGASYSPLPYAAFHGNMWLAKCSYVQKLVTVKELSQRLGDIRKVNVTNPHHLGKKIVFHDGFGHNVPREYDGLPAGRPAAEMGP